MAFVDDSVLDRIVRHERLERLARDVSKTLVRHASDEQLQLVEDKPGLDVLVARERGRRARLGRVH